MITLETLNQTAFLHLNADLSTPAWKVNIAIVAAEYLIYFIPVFLVGLWCWGSKSQRELALKACIVAVVALGINQILGIVYPHPRPFVIGLGHPLITHASDSSFPSDHATIFLALGLTLLFANVRSAAGWTTLFLGSCVAWARIFLGVHYPLDMAGAVAVVVAVCLFINPIWSRVGESATEQAAKIYGTLFARPIALGWIRR